MVLGSETLDLKMARKNRWQLCAQKYIYIYIYIYILHIRIHISPSLSLYIYICIHIYIYIYICVSAQLRRQPQVHPPDSRTAVEVLDKWFPLSPLECMITCLYVMCIHMYRCLHVNIIVCYVYVLCICIYALDKSYLPILPPSEIWGCVWLCSQAQEGNNYFTELAERVEYGNYGPPSRLPNGCRGRGHAWPAKLGTAIFHTKNCRTKNLWIKIMKSLQEIRRRAKKIHLLRLRICLTQTPNLEILSLKIGRKCC